jgi:hypothetical protein
MEPGISSASTTDAIAVGRPTALVGPAASARRTSIGSQVALSDARRRAFRPRPAGAHAQRAAADLTGSALSSAAFHLRLGRHPSGEEGRHKPGPRGEEHAGILVLRQL